MFAKFLVLVSLFFSLSVLAEGETEKALKQLGRQIELANKIKRTTDRGDIGRLIVIEQATQGVVQSIHKFGLLHTATLNEYLKQNLTYKSSTSYFNYIQTMSSKPLIQELYTIMAEITKERGLDDFNFNKMTFHTYSQVWELFKELLKRDLPEKVKTEIKAMAVDFGNLLAIASNGDNIPTFEAGRAMFLKIEKLYPLIYESTINRPTYELFLNIQGLNELYAEYARIK